MYTSLGAVISGNEEKQMKIFAKTINMDRTQWLLQRRKGICGSDASVVLGINPYRSVLQLWKDKTGQIPVDETRNEYMYFGNVMEPVIKKEFMKRTGLKVRAKNAILQSAEYPFMLADLDGIVKDDETGELAVFEAKTASEYKKGIWEKEVPEEYMAQVQHYLCVTGFKKAYVCAIVGGNSFYCHEIYRDEEYIENLVEKERKFWECVESRTSPVPDGSQATVDYINESYPESNKMDMELPFGAEMLISRYLEVEEQIKILTTQKNECSNKLKTMLKENERGHAGSHSVKWITVQKQSLDTKKVKELLGNSYDDYLQSSSYRKFSVA